MPNVPDNELDLGTSLNAGVSQAAVSDHGNAQASAQDAVTTPVVLNLEALRSLGAILESKFKRYEADRKLAELKWARNARQYLGIYDQEIEHMLDKNRSRAYPKLTRVKVVSMLSRLMNLLFPTSDKCWGIAPTAVPELGQDDLQGVLDKLTQGAQGQQVTDDQIEQAIRDFAQKRADALELEIEDQLQELGGNHNVSFVHLCRQVIKSGILYGMGVLKGPFTEKQKRRTWQKDAAGRLVAVPFDAFRPRFEWVPIWDYYPDLSAKYLHQMEGVFERHVMAKHHLMALKQRADFFADQIDAALEQWPNGNFVRKTFETELRTMGVQLQVTDLDRNKFEALSWEGYVSGKDLEACGVKVPEDKRNSDVRACVWFMGNIIVKAELDPWLDLDTDGEMPMYHHFIFEEDESTLIGQGLPNIVRDSQMNLAAVTRMMIDNGSVLRVFEMNTELLSLNQDVSSITPDKIFYREDANPATQQIPAIRPIELPVHVQELKGMVEMFQSFADQETFVNAATGGDMSKGPSEPFRTAAGASMLKGDAALPFKDVVRNFDLFIESVVGSIIVFNRNFNPDPGLQGDFQPMALGATSLIAKEVLGIQLDNFATTLTDEEKQYVKFRELTRARAKVRDLVVDDIVMNDAQCDAVDQATQAQQQQQMAQAQKLQEAQIRQLLAASLKDITQGGKNSAAADATTAKVLLDALEKGLPIDVALKSLAAAQTGGANGTGQATGGGGVAAGSAAQQSGGGVAGAPEAVGAAGGQAGGGAAAMPTM